MIKESHNKTKIGIMTWYTYYNYGSVLQSYALYRTLEKMSCQPFLIRYNPRGRAKSRLSKRYILSSEVWDHSFINYYSISKERKKLFDCFVSERMTETGECDNRAELKQIDMEFDKFICGSDQIWSPLDFDSNYYLGFVEGEGRRIAYAPSIGLRAVDDDAAALMREYIRRFDYLSVREKQGADIIAKISGRDAEVVLDPVLLFDKDEWTKNLGIDENDLLKEEYILFYFLGNFGNYKQLIEYISNCFGKRVFLIHVSNGENEKKYKLPFEVGPEQFVSLIKNAYMFFTDSYHGTLFSLIYHTPFVTIKRFDDNDVYNQNSRVINILSITKLLDRFIDISEIDEIVKTCKKTIDFSNVDYLIANEREKSLGFLKKALTGEYQLENDKNKEFIITDICCGCGACASICKKDAISIVKNDLGFWESQVDFEKCIRCNLCKKVCPFVSINSNRVLDGELYAGKINDTKVLRNSSSGGVAYAISEYMFNKGYAVYGCVYDEKNRIAVHRYARNMDEIKLFQGSKYLQSYTEGVIREINDNSNRAFVFVGTPCQAAAVDIICRKNGLRKKVLIVDLICHGVPSSLLWEKYLYEKDKQYDLGETPTVSFRDKSRASWKERTIRLEGNNHTYYGNQNDDEFYQLFISQDCFSKSCYECPYRKKSSADVRLGDYWGEKYPDSTNGVSMMIIFSDMGRRIINELVENGIIEIEKNDINDYYKMQYPENPLYPLYQISLLNEMKKNSNRSLKDIIKTFLMTDFYGDRLYKVLQMEKKDIMHDYNISEEDADVYIHNKKKLADLIIRKYGRHIGIYGLGYRGKLLYHILLNTDVSIDFIMDKDTRIQFEKMLKDWGNIPLVDVMIITPVRNAEEIKKELSSKIEFPLVTIDELAEDFWEV